MSQIDLKEVAYHEAGHAVIGFLFYPPVEVTIEPHYTGDGRFLGATIVNLPCPLIFDDFHNKLCFRLYLKIAIYIWAGEYFQKKVARKIDDAGLKVDNDAFTIYFNEKQLKVFESFKDGILEIFFGNEIITEMVNILAKELLKSEKLGHKQIESLLSMYNFDYGKQLELLMDKYYVPICEKYDELIN